MGKQPKMRNFLQGIALGGGVVVAGLVVASACTQIDAYKKIVDYKRQYEDYKDQTAQLDQMANAEKINIFESVMGGAMDNRLNYISASSPGFFEANYAPSELENGRVRSGAGLRQLGTFNREAGGTSLQACWKSLYGSQLEFSDTGGSVNLGSECAGEDQQRLAALSIQPGTTENIVTVNTETETEITRGLYFNEFPMLDVIRADLAWLRDREDLWTPFRFPHDRKAVSLDEVSVWSQEQQRLGAILASRGLQFVDYSSVPEGTGRLQDNERVIEAAQGIGTVSAILSAFGSYPATMASVAPIKAAIQDVTAESIDQANDGDRQAMLLKFAQLNSEINLLLQESNQRYERLQGMWLASTQHEHVDNLLSSPHR